MARNLKVEAIAAMKPARPRRQAKPGQTLKRRAPRRQVNVRIWRDRNGNILRFNPATESVETILPGGTVIESSSTKTSGRKTKPKAKSTRSHGPTKKEIAAAVAARLGGLNMGASSAAIANEVAAAAAAGAAAGIASEKKAEGAARRSRARRTGAAKTTGKRAKPKTARRTGKMTTKQRSEAAKKAWRKRRREGTAPPKGAARSAGKKTHLGRGKGKGWVHTETGRVDSWRNKRTGRVVTDRDVRQLRGNPASTWQELIYTGVGMVLGNVVAEMVDRIYVTRMPTGGKNPYYAQDAIQRIMVRPDGMRIGISVGLALVWLVLASTVGRGMPRLGNVLAGMFFGGIARVGTQVTLFYLLPALFKVPDGNEKNWGNRIAAWEQSAEQDPLYKELAAQDAAPADLPGQQDDGKGNLPDSYTYANAKKTITPIGPRAVGDRPAPSGPQSAPRVQTSTPEQRAAQQKEAQRLAGLEAEKKKQAALAGHQAAEAQRRAEQLARQNTVFQEPGATPRQQPPAPPAPAPEAHTNGLGGLGCNCQTCKRCYQDSDYKISRGEWRYCDCRRCQAATQGGLEVPHKPVRIDNIQDEMLRPSEPGDPSRSVTDPASQGSIPQPTAAMPEVRNDPSSLLMGIRPRWDADEFAGEAA